MKLHTVFITRNRLELTKQAITSYFETVTVPYFVGVVDNASTDGTQDWLRENLTLVNTGFCFLPENRYPGYACNHGWGDMWLPDDASFLQRADNDFAFLPGWCDEVWERFQDPALGQLGLRTDEEEAYCESNVGGNNIIRRELWDAGLRYDETPWPEYPPGYSEDSFFSPKVVKLGWKFGRVKRHIIQDLSLPTWEDPYYQESYQARNIGHRLRYKEDE